MKPGDVVIHKKKRITGKIIYIANNKMGVIVDYSDHTGVMCRWTHIKHLEVINDKKE